MHTAMKQDPVPARPGGVGDAGAGEAGPTLPDVVIRFPATSAIGAMGFGALFFCLGLWIASVNHHRNLGVGLSLSLASVAAVVGANYWRRHLHVVARLTARQLVLRRDGAVDWGDIAEIKANTIHTYYRGAARQSDFVCIRLKSGPAPKGKLDRFFRNARRAVSGYDIIVGASELSCTAEWFVAECRKRMAAAGAAGVAPDGRVAA